MSQNPYESPQGSIENKSTSPTSEMLQLQARIENTVRTRNYTIIVLLIVGVFSTLKIAGILTPTFIPIWGGVAVVASCLVRILILVRRNAILKQSFSRIPNRRN